MLKFSIITICFNAGEALRRTIESVNEQSYPDIEHVIIDGGSTDGSVGLIKNLARRNVRWVSERDKGIADAFNKGTKQATGDYFCYLNAGDLFESSATVSNVAATIAETYAKDARLFAGDFICETDDGSFLTRTEVAPTAFRHTNPINHQSVIISRELALAYPYDRHLKLGMDYDLWLRLIRDEIPLTHLSIPIARYATDGISSNLNWAVHNLIERELLWHKHFTKRLAIHNLSLIVFRALTLKLSILARKLVGRSTIKFIKKTGLSRKIRFVRMQKNKGVDQNPQTSAN